MELILFHLENAVYVSFLLTKAEYVINAVQDTEIGVIISAMSVVASFLSVIFQKAKKLR